MKKNEKGNRDNQRKCSILLQIFGTVRPLLPHWGNPHSNPSSRLLALVHPKCRERWMPGTSCRAWQLSSLILARRRRGSSLEEKRQIWIKDNNFYNKNWVRFLLSPSFLVAISNSFQHVCVAFLASWIYLIRSFLSEHIATTRESARVLTLA